MGPMRARTVVATVIATLAFAGCTAEADPTDQRAVDPPTSSSPSPSAPSTSSEPTEEAPPTTPLEGEWALEQTKADVVRHLRRYGFDDLVERFVRVE